MSSLTLIDCTLRDGGYYNNWNFPKHLVKKYLEAMDAAGIHVVELGFRSTQKNGFRGACAYTTDDYIRSLNVPDGLQTAVMVNASELLAYNGGPVKATEDLFADAAASPVDIVRLACHIHEVAPVMPACLRLKQMGYAVGLNLMQIADRSADELQHVAEIVERNQLDFLYFADSLGSLRAENTVEIVNLLKRHWHGALGVHTHDNLGQALSNTLAAVASGVTWVDCTITGMGRGPGNVQTEYMVVEKIEHLRHPPNLNRLFSLIASEFRPMQIKFGWGTNPYYYLAGKYGVHPTYVQEMLSDPRYEEADILTVLEYLRGSESKKFSSSVLEAGRQMYGGDQKGNWAPASVMSDKEVLILGSGPSVSEHRDALESYIEKYQPVVLALNTLSNIDTRKIHYRAVCHPLRLIADCDVYASLEQTLILPWSRCPTNLQQSLERIPHFDYGLAVGGEQFEFYETGAKVPNFLAISYALAMATSGRASKIYLAGFDGYGADDPRTVEMNTIFSAYQSSQGALPFMSVTPTQYKIPATSIYAL